MSVTNTTSDFSEGARRFSKGDAIVAWSVVLLIVAGRFGWALMFGKPG